MILNLLLWLKPLRDIDGTPIKSIGFFPSEDILKKNLSVFKDENIDLDSTLKVAFNQTINKRVPSQAQITETVKKELKLRGYSQKTKKAYLHHIGRYISYFTKAPKRTR